MHDFTFRATGAVIGMLEKVIKANIIVEGVENIPPNPCLFVVNHFTRLETFLLPYILHKHKGMIVHSLASSTLFKGMFGKYLSSMGTVPKREPRRNRMIIRDLVTGQANWVIYPEGLMVKNKSVFEKGHYKLNTPVWQGPPHTGAAMLGLKTEIVRQDCLRAMNSSNDPLVRAYEIKYGFHAFKELSQMSAVILPVNITYYPLRPGQNLISDIAGLFLKDIPARLDEELKTEGRILLTDSDINIYFGKPIEIGPAIQKAVNFTGRYLPFLDKMKRDALIMAFKRKPLTHTAMEKIYTRTAIHIDHLFCMALRKANEQVIHRKDFARALYLCAVEAANMERRRTHPTLERDLIKCIVDEDYGPLESICQLAESVGALEREGEEYVIHHKYIKSGEHSFHNIRLKNTAVVIANELEPLKRIVSMIDRNINMPVHSLRQKLADTLVQRNRMGFERDYERYYKAGVSKPKEVGEPIFLHKRGSREGIVLTHGYLAAPMEMRDMAEYLFEHGYSVYVPCLKGMGTTPEQLNEVSYEDWIYSFDKAYAIIRNSCRDVYAGGFSAGGLLALIGAARKKDAVKAVFSINAPIHLQNVKSKLVPGIISWNDFVSRIHLDEFKRAEFIDNETESPDVNYTRNALRGVVELKRLIGECQESLKDVVSPALIVQGDSDPVVKADSAEYIREHLGSDYKMVHMVKAGNHIIVRKDGSEAVFESVVEFLRSYSEHAK